MNTLTSRPSRLRPSAGRRGPLLSPLCTHVKGHGGVKGTMRAMQAAIGRYPFVARFDVASYFDTIRHDVLLDQLAQARVPEWTLEVARRYLEVSDTGHTGVGLTAGGSLSSLLGALYLLPLDRALEHLTAGGRLFYRRYMDDVVILAKTRHQLRKAIRAVHRALSPLGLRLHERQKRHIGRTAGGFDFLGYRLQPGRLLRPSEASVDRLRERARRLCELGASMARLRQHATRWLRWLTGGLDGLVSRNGGLQRYGVRILTRLDIPGPSARGAAAVADRLRPPPAITTPRFGSPTRRRVAGAAGL